MYRKGLLTFILGICLAGLATLEAQSVSPSSSAVPPPDPCSSITDVVDREICLAEHAVMQCSRMLSRTDLSKQEQTHWQQMRSSQEKKILRFKQMNGAERQQLQQLADRAEQARKAAQSH